jgi:tripartite ATP-independent transporter DctM subunit
MFGVQILLYAHFLPRHVFAADAAPTRPTEDTNPIQILASLFPLVSLVMLVLGGIYAGWFTPTESAAVGSLGAIAVAAWRRRLSWPIIWRILVETGSITVSIMFLIIAANIYSRLLAFSGMPLALESWVKAVEMNFYVLLVMYAVIIVLLGTIIDAVSIMLIMVPMFLPLLAGYDVNLIWFGIVTVIAVEIGLLTPPLGLSVYVIKSTIADENVSLSDIFKGAAPYALTMFAVLLLIIFVPRIALVLIK